MATIALVSALPSKVVAVSLQEFLANDLEGLLKRNSSLKDVDQEAANKTLLMPVPDAKNVGIPTIQILQWYQIEETEDEDYLIAFEAPAWWPKDIFQSFFYGVLAPSFHYFVNNQVPDDDQEYCFLLQGTRIDDVLGDESYLFPFTNK